ncbi:helix-turn-helix transcriptional regulator [Paenibacillus sp. FSL K6-1230]
MKSLVLELDQRGLTTQKQDSSTPMPHQSQSSLLPTLEHRSSISPVNNDVPSPDSVVIPLSSSPQHSLKTFRESHKIPSRGQGIMVLTLFIQLLVRIARLYKEKTRITPDHTEMYIKRCIEFMYQNMDRNIQMKSISSAVNLHPSYLYRIFRKSTGMTPTSYLTMLRMEKAKKLLMNTDIPVSEMSDYVGVSSRQYFHSLFRKYTGLPPVEYRISMDREGYHYPKQQDISSVRGPDNNIDF